ncbi:MAG: hypothetical protein O3C21_10720 [Verrucomicrobia bacterium]|nr:hypothetical protein [Verrucomicrobiota bacterium]
MSRPSGEPKEVADSVVPSSQSRRPARATCDFSKLLTQAEAAPAERFPQVAVAVAGLSEPKRHVAMRLVFDSWVRTQPGAAFDWLSADAELWKEHADSLRDA